MGRAALLAASGAAAAALALLVLAQAGPRDDPAARGGSGPVPDVAGMGFGEARLKLARAGFGCAVVAEEDGGDDEGPRLVAEQRERPGSHAPRGGVVRLEVSEPYPEGPRYPRDPQAGLLPPGCADLRGARGRPRWRPASSRRGW